MSKRYDVNDLAAGGVDLGAAIDSAEEVQGGGEPEAPPPHTDTDAPGGAHPEDTADADQEGHGHGGGEAGLDVLAVLDEAIRRLAKGLGEQGRLAVELMGDGFIAAAARHPDRAGVGERLRRLRVKAFTRDATRIETAVEKERQRIQDAQAAEAARAEEARRRRAARESADRRAREALHEDWPRERPGSQPVVFALLDVNKEGRPKSCLANAFKILRDDPRWGRHIRMNRLGDKIEIYGEGDRNETLVTTELTEWIADNYHMQCTSAIVKDALLATAEGNPYHPVQEYLNDLIWDGERRIHRLLPEVLGLEADKDPEHALHQKFIRRMLIGAVARVLNPGCKVDTALILVGEQGAKKSSFFRTLFGPAWFGSSPIPIGDKNAPIQLRSTWGYEVAEMESISRKTAEEVKQFLSEQNDLFRQIYERNARSYPRHSVIVGSTNRTEFLIDPTGSRRFWPITIPGDGLIDLALLRELRDQVWAEAMAAYQVAAPMVEAGSLPCEEYRWWFEREEDSARAEAARRHQVADIWEDVVLTWAKSKTGAFTIAECLADAVKMEVDRMGDADKRRIGAILRHHGYRNRSERRRSEGRNVSVWERAPTAQARSPREEPASAPSAREEPASRGSDVPRDVNGVPC